MACVTFDQLLHKSSLYKNAWSHVNYLQQSAVFYMQVSTRLQPQVACSHDLVYTLGKNLIHIRLSGIQMAFYKNVILFSLWTEQLARAYKY